jgi:hypothetical protein
MPVLLADHAPCISPTLKPRDDYFNKGGSPANSATMANHASTRTTQLYDRHRDEMNLDEVERVVI